MSGKKLTDNEIIKALECCVSANYICPHTCPMLKNKECLTSLRKNALDLITRQQAEIERLKNEYEESKKRNQDLVYALQSYKFEAYKEFATRLKIEYAKGMRWFKKKESYYVDVSDIDNLVKEMVGENNV